MNETSFQLQTLARCYIDSLVTTISTNFHIHILILSSKALSRAKLLFTNTFLNLGSWKLWLNLTWITIVCLGWKTDGTIITLLSNIFAWNLQFKYGLWVISSSSVRLCLHCLWNQKWLPIPRIMWAMIYLPNMISLYGAGEVTFLNQEGNESKPRGRDFCPLATGFTW